MVDWIEHGLSSTLVVEFLHLLDIIHHRTPSYLGEEELEGVHLPYLVFRCIIRKGHLPEDHSPVHAS